MGQLGLGDTTARNVPTSVPLMSSGVTKVQAAFNTTLALKEGRLYAWGEDYDGMLAQGVPAGGSHSPVPTLLEGGGVTAIAAASMAQGTCAIVGGRLKCWGVNGGFSLLGDGTSTQRLAAVANTALTSTASVLGVAMGVNPACAVVDGGTECWGKNSSGQLGDGTNTDRSASTAVSGLAVIEARKLGAGDEFACALLADQVRCWGKNTFGQLGNGFLLDSNVPVDVLRPDGSAPLKRGLTELGVGAGHACAIQDGAVYCWGSNSFGQLGDLTTSARSVPVRVLESVAGESLISVQATALALGRNHSCFVKNGGVKCWGKNSEGPLGDGSTTDRGVAVDVVGLTSGVEAIAAGD